VQCSQELKTTYAYGEAGTPTMIKCLSCKNCLHILWKNKNKII